MNTLFPESHRIEYKVKLTDALEKEITSTGGLSSIKNLEDFFSGYSKPMSRELMRVYKDLELVEHLGSGLNRILNVYTKESFVIKQNFMKNIFYSNTEPLNDLNATTQETTRDKIIKLLKQNSRYTKNDLMDILNKGDSTIKEHLDRLKRDGVINRMGSTKAGYWKVLDE